MISASSSGSWDNTEKFLRRMKSDSIFKNLARYGDQGVAALALATPIDTGETANSWYYKITKQRGKYILSWHNRNTVNGANVAILIQYGHGTGTGGYVVGRDYINPATRPLFDKIADDVWNEVTRNA